MIFDASSIYISLKRKSIEPLKNSATLDLAFYEIGNALLKEFRRGLIDEASLVAMIGVLDRLGDLMTVMNFQKLGPERIARLCRESKLTFYDAAYLSCALSTNQSLTTDDKALREEAKKRKIIVQSIL
ncbi:MAG: type II toxin-antitoxin system VapC family toxin [Nitrososphaerota archaeon]|nr:type II toxin-antitoxin system VapC family toxin [Nitrososphaerota archaeon]